MSKKKPTAAKENTRSVTVGITVTPEMKRLLRQQAQEQARTISSLTYLLLMESPTWRRLLKSAA